MASGGDEHRFEQGAVGKLYEHSHGTPREATILADNALLLAYLQKRKRVTPEIVDSATRRLAD